MIYFKENNMRNEFLLLKKELKNIVYVIDAVMTAMFKKETGVTSVYREDPKSPHHYYRAIDLRSRDLKDEQCMELINYMNLMFPYGKKQFQTMICHDSGPGLHFHVQVKA